MRMEMLYLTSLLNQLWLLESSSTSVAVVAKAAEQCTAPKRENALAIFTTPRDETLMRARDSWSKELSWKESLKRVSEEKSVFVIFTNIMCC